MTERKYLIGMDGGGTKTKCIVTDLALNPLFECSGGPSNFNIIGTEKVSATILELVIESISQLNISVNHVASILIGTTGAGRFNDAEKLKNDFLAYSESKGYKFDLFSVESDARIALEGAFSGRPGALLIAGTGSIIFGKDSNQNIHRVGGFGRLIGDEGSGLTIGKKGLNQVAKFYDGRAQKTILAEFLTRDFGITDSSQLITEVYTNNFDLASFAPKVIEAAELGDKYANRILQEETDELLLHIDIMFKILKVRPQQLCFVGGLIAKDNYYSGLLKKKIFSRLPDIQITLAENSPEIGAAIMARNKLLG